MLWRAIVVWLGLMLVAIANGAVREKLIVPRFGAAAGHVASTLMLCAAIIAAAWSSMPWILGRNLGDAAAGWKVGALWLALTLGFEFLAGHYLFGNPWSRLLADYNIARGRIWVLVPLVTLLAPWRAAMR